mgnify:FL=1
MNKKYVISIHNLTKEFDKKKVVNNINLNIKEGTIVGIIGRNGSGKTVLLKMIAQLYFPTEGSIEYKNNLCITKDFGFLIDVGFLDNETGFNNLKTLALLKNIIGEDEIYEIMKFVKLDPKNKIKYKNYSTGMKQKLKIAQALMEKPSVLVLDEPFNGLDIESVKYFRDVLKKLKDKGITIIITSHYQEDIDLLCDDVYEISNGVLKKYETQK